jgi:hypothetical protein
MHLYDLIEKLKKIEDSSVVKESVEECGEVPIQMIGQPHAQQDNVTMNVSMNGQGPGGIKNLMDILRSIEKGKQGDKPKLIIGKPEHDHEEPMMGDMVASMADEETEDNVTGGKSPFTTDERDMEEEFDDDEETYANSANGSPGKHIHGIDAVTFSGDDMNSKGKISPVARAPGTNSLREPSNFDESLVNRLSAMYQEIKEAGDKKL